VDPAPPVAPKTERTYSYKLYFGPKNLDTLSQVGSELNKIVDFGFFDIIAKPLLYCMHFIYRFIPNYGIAIIFITILVKILFWPLSSKSYKSMSQMKRLQPKMAELRAKYKHDKKMMNQELMNLYKVYKVNPLGGCLPMVLQIPVFFAFYKMLYQAIELRHAPFFLWINDLAAPDRLLHFDFQIPLMAPPLWSTGADHHHGSLHVLSAEDVSTPWRSHTGKNDDVYADIFHFYLHKLSVRACFVLVGQQCSFNGPTVLHH